MDRNDRETVRSKLAVLGAAAAMVIIGFTLFIVMRDLSPTVDLGRLFVRKPGGPLILAGFAMLVISGITLLFRNQMGPWAKRFREWLADFFPDWQHLSGVPDEEEENFLEHRAGRKLVVIVAAIDLCVGFCLIGVGMVLNTGP